MPIVSNETEGFAMLFLDHFQAKVSDDILAFRKNDVIFSSRRGERERRIQQDHGIPQLHELRRVILLEKLDADDSVHMIRRQVALEPLEGAAAGNLKLNQLNVLIGNAFLDAAQYIDIVIDLDEQTIGNDGDLPMLVCFLRSRGKPVALIAHFDRRIKHDTSRFVGHRLPIQRFGNRISGQAERIGYILNGD